MTREEMLTEIFRQTILLFPFFKAKHKNNNTKLTSLQFLTIMYLCEKDNVPMNSITSFLGVSKQQTTRLIDTLVDLNIVTRVNNPNSRREILIIISENGKNLVNKIKLERENDFIESYSKLSDEDIESFYSYSKKINEIISKIKLS